MSNNIYKSNAHSSLYFPGAMFIISHPMISNIYLDYNLPVVAEWAKHTFHLGKSLKNFNTLR